MNIAVVCLVWFCLLLAGCAQQPPDENRPPIEELPTSSLAIKVAITAEMTPADIESQYRGDVIVWHPEAGFAILVVTVDSDTPLASQAVETGSSRAWAGGLSVWSGGLSVWSGGEPEETGIVLQENALLWDKLSLGPTQLELAPQLGEGVTIAVIDTGVDVRHPVFEGRLVSPELWFDFVDNDAIPEEAEGAAYGHGTAVAGIILQVAPNAKIMPLRALNGDGEGSLAAVVRAIDWAVQHGVDIIQMSLGTEVTSEVLEAMIDFAAAQGIYMVASAGNMASVPTYPALLGMQKGATGEMVVGVGSVSADDEKSWFSNFLPEDYAGFDDDLKLVAFGETVYTAVPDQQVGYWSGTSMAAPMVAGALALAIGEGAEYRHPRQLAQKVVDEALDIDLEERHGGVAYEIENRLQLGIFLCDILNSDLPVCEELDD